MLVGEGKKDKKWFAQMNLLDAFRGKCNKMLLQLNFSLLNFISSGSLFPCPYLFPVMKISEVKELFQLQRE